MVWKWYDMGGDGTNIIIYGIKLINFAVCKREGSFWVSYQDKVYNFSTSTKKPMIENTRNGMTRGVPKILIMSIDNANTKKVNKSVFTLAQFMPK